MFAIWQRLTDLAQTLLTLALFCALCHGVASIIRASDNGSNLSCVELSERVAQQHLQYCESCRFAGLTVNDLANGPVGVCHDSAREVNRGVRTL